MNMRTKIVFLALILSMLSSLMVLNVDVCVTNASASEQPLWQGNGDRNKIVVISDLHLGIDDNYTETLKNRKFLVDFLQKLQKTADVRELVINGDFLDEWFLPVNYKSYSDERKFYKDVIANNQSVIDELNNLTKSGIKLVYVIGNHDMLLQESVLREAIPNIIQIKDSEGLGVYYTGDRKEIAIEHGHRYDVFSAPDAVTNKELCGNDNTILPAGYFYARYAATWVLEGRPKVEKKLPIVTKIPNENDVDQYGAYLYYLTLKDISNRMTPYESLDQKIFDIKIAGFDDSYTYLDFYPSQQEDGTISAPVLFKNIQRTWEQRQKINNVKVPNDFIEAVKGTLNWDYYFKQAKVQYLENPQEHIDVVVFGHTHVPVFQEVKNSKYYINSGTWIDHNTDYPEASRTFAVITTGQKDVSTLYKYNEDGTIGDVIKK